jgi:hypothetical protein
MTQLAKRPASIVRTYTQQVRDHAAAMERLRDRYFADLKRAEATYFDGVKRLTEEVSKATEPAEHPGPNGEEQPTGTQ